MNLLKLLSVVVTVKIYSDKILNFYIPGMVYKMLTILKVNLFKTILYHKAIILSKYSVHVKKNPLYIHIYQNSEKKKNTF